MRFSLTSTPLFWRRSTATSRKRTFIPEAEIYNLDLLFRAKKPQLTPPEDLKKLLIPVYGIGKNMKRIGPGGWTNFLKRALYNAGRAGQVYGARSGRSKRALMRRSCCIFQHAETGRAALLCRANLERRIINVIEGVRYGLSSTPK